MRDIKELERELKGYAECYDLKEFEGNKDNEAKWIQQMLSQAEDRGWVTCLEWVLGISDRKARFT